MVPQELEALVPQWVEALDLGVPNYLSYETDYAYVAPAMALAESAAAPVGT